MPIERLFRRLSAGSNARALAIMFVSTIAFSMMHAGVRTLSGDLHPFEIAFFRNAFGLTVIFPWFLRYGTVILATQRLGLHSVRAGLNVVAMLCFFFALSITPLSRVAALSFTAPVFATVLAIVLLGEKVRMRRWIAIAIGFAGTFVAIRPGFADIDLGSILVLTQSIAWAAALITIKVLSRTESSITIATYMVLMMTPLSLIPALFYWQTPTLEQLAWLLGIGVLGTLGQLLMTQSLKEGDTTVVMPIDFFKLIWASALGFLLFAEVPDRFTWIGGMMIFASTAYIAYRESKLRAAPGR
jgi:drug/metabolite transporter (DMT)-like permease